MGAKIIEVNVLPKEEAWHLFKAVAEISDDSILHDDAREVAKECRGLPLAIVVVAKALRSNRTVESWKQALEQLKEYTIRDLKGVEDLVFSRIEFSYAYLRSDEARSLLLLCSLFPEDYSIPVECLVRFGKGLELFQHRRKLVDVRYKVDTLIGDLKSSYLLLNVGHREDCVKLHDVVRDVCLKIASKGEHEFLVTNAGVREKYSFTEISLILKDSIHDLLMFCKACPRLRLLRLEFRLFGKINLSRDSFTGMENLKVMELNNSYIKFSLSWPGQMLRSLRTLCLNYCNLGTGMSSMLGHMMQLETLSFFQSEIQDDQFPTEIAWLSNLKLLDLRVKSSRHPLPGGVFSSLKNLEELYLGSHPHLQLGRDKKEEIECLKEISSISNLACLQIGLYDPGLLLPLLQEFDTQNLLRFHIAVADDERTLDDLSREYQFRKSFKLSWSNNEALKQLLDTNVTSIVNRSENLTLNLSKSSCLRNLVPGLGENGFINLKKLHLDRGQYECLIDSTTKLVARQVFENLVFMELHDVKLKEICNGFLPPRCFSQLQELKVAYIGGLEYLCKGQIEPPSLCNLRSIEVIHCAKITTLFSQPILKCLVKLQEIEVRDCENLESIVLKEESLKEEVLELPQLNALTLWRTGLSRLLGHSMNITGFASKDDKVQAFFDQVSLPRLELLKITGPGYGPKQLIGGGKMPSGSLNSLKSMGLSACQSIRCIAKADAVTLLQNLQELKVYDCNELEFLLDFEGLKVPNTLSNKGLEILPKLEFLFLRYCLRLTNIWGNFSEGVRVFQNLTSLKVTMCPSLNCLFYPPCVANMLMSLENLHIYDCSKMHRVISGEDGEVSREDNAQQHREITPERTSKEFVFPRLSYLLLANLDNLRSFGGSHQEDYCEFKFPQLTVLIIESCPELKKFCFGKLDAPLLKKVSTRSGLVENFEAPIDLKDREICGIKDWW